MAVDPAASPLAFFASEMARMRKAAGLSQPALAKRLGYSASQVSKIEICERIPQADQASRLDEIFNTDGHFARLQPLVENTSMLPWFQELFKVEASAEEIRTYESYAIPGLLQTEDYARIAVESARPILSDEEIDQAVALRMTRQDILDRDRPPRIWAVIDESALCRLAGSPAVMRKQCEHLVCMGRRSNVVIQVITNDEGICCAGGRPFTLLSFRHQIDMVYVESLYSAKYIRDRDETARYALTLDHLRGSALSDDKSMALIERISHEMA
jgi:transcriptional regulator with XRE-family HTH domain